MITKEQLREMDEAALRARVLMPLFRRMGYKDVRHYHGGVLEQGKDIVMWEMSTIGVREHFAVVVKAQKINANVNAAGGISTLVMQIQQAFGSPYLDSVTREQCRITRCFVVCSQEITKEAHEALRNALEASSLNTAVNVVDGERLWELARQHLPLSEIAESASQLHQALNAIGSDLGVKVSRDAKGVNIEIQPGDSTVKGVADPIVMNFAFPDDEDGKAMNAAMKDFLATGEQVVIDKRFIKNFTLPTALADLMGTEGTTPEQVVLGPTGAGPGGTLTLAVENGAGERVQLESIRVKLAAVGQKQMRLTVDDVHEPFSMDLTIDTENGTILLKGSLSPTRSDAFRAFSGMRFFSALATGGIFSVRDTRSDLPILKGAIPPGLVTPVPKELMRICEWLATIQRATAVRLALPARDITNAEAALAAEIAEAVTIGQLKAAGGNMRFEIDASSARAMRDAGEFDKAGRVRLVAAHSVDLMGSTVELGELIVTADGAVMPSHARSALEQELADVAREFVKIEMIVPENQEVTMTYTRWWREPSRTVEGP